MQVKVHAAKTQLSKLIEAALRGEDVVISRGDTPVVRLVPVKRNRFRFGAMARELPDPLPDFLEPMNEEDLGLRDGDESRFD